MSKREEKIALYQKAADNLGLSLDPRLIEKVTLALGPSIYNKDAETVSCSDPAELERVRENFLKKKLELTLEDAALDAAIREVCETMGSANRQKYRALFYALLATKFDKTSIYA